MVTTKNKQHGEILELILDRDEQLVMVITSSKIYIINQKPLVGSRLNYNTKYKEGGCDDHLTKIYVENLDLSKYTQYRILVPQNNGNVKLILLDGVQARPHKSQTWMQK